MGGGGGGREKILIGQVAHVTSIYNKIQNNDEKIHVVVAVPERTMVRIS